MNEPKAGQPREDTKAQLFAVNAISFHPVHGTFSTAGKLSLARLPREDYHLNALSQALMGQSAFGTRRTRPD